MTRIWALLRRIARIIDSQRGSLGLALLGLGAAAIFLWLELRPDWRRVRISAGDALGRRSEVAHALRTAAGRHRLSLEIVPSAGSMEALELLESGAIDAALVQGGLPPLPHIRQLAALDLEMMHLLVRSDSAIYDLEDMRDAVIDTSPPGSGTRTVALEILASAGLHPEDDFVEGSFEYRELAELPEDELPDVIFHVSALPSEVARGLLHHRGYRLLQLPMAPALRLRNRAISPATIPAFAYGSAPAVPRDDLPTIGTRMLLVTRQETDENTATRILASLEDEAFARIAGFDPLGTAMFANPEMPLHPAAIEWLHRNDAWFSSEAMQGLESLRSFLVSLIVAAALAHRYLRRRRLRGFESYLSEVTRIEREALELERETRLDLARLLTLRTRIGDVKGRALEGLVGGALHSDELLTSFLVHVSDVRSHLNVLILHERERRERVARTQGANEEAVLRELWQDALAEEHDERS